MNAKFKLLESAQFTALVGKIGRTQATLTADIQTAAINAVAHSLLHGNVMPAFILYGAMGKSLRKDSLVAWLEKHGALAWAKEDKKFLHFKREGIKFDDDYAEMLAGDPWNTAIKQPEPKSKYDIDAMFDKFMASTRAIVKKAESNPGIKVVNVELLNYLSAASGKFFDDKVATEAKGKPKVVVTKREKSNAQAKQAIAQAHAEARAEAFNANIVAPSLVQSA